MAGKAALVVFVIAVAERSDAAEGFNVIPRRWRIVRMSG
jgi:hypothetical protein